MEEKRTILFVDEAGFALLPMAVSTYAPCGQTPILPVPLTHDHLSVIGALSTDGRLFMQMQRKAYKGPDVIGFLRLLLRKIPGKLLIIWDGASIHRCQALKDFLAQGAAKRLHLEPLPGYAPELNPQEGVWNLLKRRELKNVCCKDLWQVEDERVSCQRASSPSQANPFAVFCSCRLPGLVVYAEINNHILSKLVKINDKSQVLRRS